MYKCVVVPLDGSALAESMLNFIVDIAGPLDLEVVLLRVVRPGPPGVTTESTVMAIDDVGRRMVDARAYLAPLVATLRDKGIRVRTEVRYGNSIVDEIIEGAREAGADLIAMTTHGRSGLGRLLFGSVAEAVLRQTEIPVFLMRMTEASVAAPAAEAALR